jgi:hypothetical protein
LFAHRDYASKLNPEVKMGPTPVSCEVNGGSGTRAAPLEATRGASAGLLRIVG